MGLQDVHPEAQAEAPRRSNGMNHRFEIDLVQGLHKPENLGESRGHMAANAVAQPRFRREHGRSCRRHPTREEGPR